MCPCPCLLSRTPKPYFLSRRDLNQNARRAERAHRPKHKPKSPSGCWSSLHIPSLRREEPSQTLPTASVKWSCSLVPSLPPRELALSRVPSTDHKHTVYMTTSPHNDDILEPSPHWLTNTNWFLSRPLATLLAGNCFLSLQLKGRLALKLQTVPVAKRGSFSPAVGWDPGITAAPLVNLWKKENKSCMGEGSDAKLVQYLPYICTACCLSALQQRHRIPKGAPVPSAPSHTGGGSAAAQNAAKISVVTHKFYHRHWKAILTTSPNCFLILKLITTKWKIQRYPRRSYSAIWFKDFFWSRQTTSH